MSIDRKADDRKLSKAVLELKFMKKSKEKREILEDAEERQQLYQGQLNKLHEGADRIVMLNSYLECKKFLPCRLSFGGMDPDIEKLNADKLTGLYKIEKRESPTPEGRLLTGMDADVDEEEMAGLAVNIQKKFGIKRKSEANDYGDEEAGRETKMVAQEDERKKPLPKPSERRLLTVDIENIHRGGGRGRGDFRGRGRGDFRGRGRGDFRGRGRGDFRGRGRGDSRGRGRGDSRGRGRGDSRGRGRGDFRGRERGDFNGRGRGDFHGRGRGDFRGRGRGDFQGRGRGRGDFRGKHEANQNGSFEMKREDFDEGSQNSSFEMKREDFDESSN